MGVRHITEVSAKGKIYYICYSDLDFEGESNELYWDIKKNSGYHKMPFNYVLRKNEIVDRTTNERISKYDLGEYFSSLS